jgi:Legionella pneumophila major outer membrane protein precursor
MTRYCRLRLALKRMVNLLCALTLGAILPAGQARGQANGLARPALFEPQPAATAPSTTGTADSGSSGLGQARPMQADATTEPGVLPDLPRPPDVPSSLFQQPPATRPYSCAPLPGPYFEQDRRLDPPCLPQPGWFVDAGVEIVGVHFKDRLVDTVQIDGRLPDAVHVPGADLDWTALPRVELGYRLSSGFGEFAVGYRGFATDGSASLPSPDGTAAVHSRLDLNTVDMDYASREFFTDQWPYVHMKWRFGLRWADAYYDTQALEPLAAAAAGTDVFERRTSNNFWGLGPHLGVELARQFHDSGLALVGWAEGATLLGRIRQNFFEESTLLGSNGLPLSGNTRESVSQDVPIINAFIGLSWQPPAYPSFRAYAGYGYEYWWNVGRNSDTLSRGELSDQGVLLRAGFNY